VQASLPHGRPEPAVRFFVVARPCPQAHRQLFGGEKATIVPFLRAPRYPPVLLVFRMALRFFANLTLPPSLWEPSVTNCSITGLKPRNFVWKIGRNYSSQSRKCAYLIVETIFCQHGIDFAYLTRWNIRCSPERLRIALTVSPSCRRAKSCVCQRHKFRVPVSASLSTRTLSSPGRDWWRLRAAASLR